ncbi:dihydrofolate reductase [Fibrella sp. HMF5335]|uniref:Dihydrofolate reductase n=1 Tax=Fibrella rubiginis TaxID=2817060 RepID=A0A939GKC5_9BACT|nr:dihydrofolate reductase family protein [Fibrella rubiginis]MBO0938346.1 dihydrofolate reductase [Fibrella rubiginis]
MSLKLSVYIATSLDGFIARPDGAIDWLTAPEHTVPGEDFGYQAFIHTVDALVMGRGTYETVLAFGEWPYAKPVFVLSHTLTHIPEQLADKVQLLALSPADTVTYLAERGFQHVYLDGGKTIQGFLRAGLVDELTLSRMPILLGEGIPLFGVTGHDIRFEHLQTQAFPNGLVQSKYRRLGAS